MAPVAGYTIFHDVSARDLEFAPGGGVIVGKNFEQFWYCSVIVPGQAVEIH